jgi:hypothetical protein
MCKQNILKLHFPPKNSFILIFSGCVALVGETKKILGGKHSLIEGGHLGNLDENAILKY